MLSKLDLNVKRLSVVLVLFFLMASATKGDMFLSVNNLQAMAKQMSEYGLMAVGVGICMISGGIDLSTVYIANLCGISAALLMQQNVPIAVAILVAILVGLACGALNGSLVTFLRVPPMLATLGTYQLFMGISILISGGSSVGGVPQGYVDFSMSYLAGVVPCAFVVFVSCVVLSSLVMSKTRFGTELYLVGTNQKAAKFSGIKVNWVLIRAYMLSGGLSAVAGLLSLSRLSSAKADFGSSYTMQCILIAVLGGVNPNGGNGKVTGIALAVVILQMMSSYLNMFPSVSSYYRDLIWGVALIGILVVNHILDGKHAKKLSAST